MDVNGVIQKGIELHQVGRLADAMGFYQQALAADPNNPDANHLLGLVLHQSGKDEQAIPLFQKAIALRPAPSYHANFAELWRRQEKWDQAIECYQQVLRVQPRDAEIRYLLGEALIRKDLFPEALAQFQQSLADGKNDSNTWACICESLRRLERLDEAIEAAKKAVALDPNSAPAWHSLGWTMMRQGKVHEAVPLINKAVSLKPDWPLVIWRRAFAHLMLGQFAEGWRDYEARWQDDELQRKTSRRLPGQVWRGQDVQGKTIYVHLEQGLGDYIHMVRYIPLIQARGAAKVTLEVPQELESLIRRSIPGVDLMPDPGQKVRYQYYVPMMSLPLAFGTLLETVPAKVPYLQPDSQAVVAWRKRLHALEGLKVGLVWAGSATHPNDRNRSIPLKDLLPLTRIPGVRFVSLQKGAGAMQVKDVPEFDLIDWTSELINFDDTAALASALDLVISVDTSVAHLAGALGVPVWTLIAMAPDFRWMLEREDSPWYPTMRLFRQKTINDWISVIERVAGELRKWSTEKENGSATGHE